MKDFVPVYGFPDYEINPLGVVRRCRSAHVLRHWFTKKGYPVVSMCCKGVAIKRKVHRLLLETFVGPCPPGQECRHLDGDPGNNALDNLCWGTKSENRQDQVRQGRVRHWGRLHRPVRDRAWRHLTVAERCAIAGAASLGVPRAAIAAHFGVNKHTVSYWANAADPSRYVKPQELCVPPVS